MKKYAFCYDMDTNSVIKAHLPMCVLSKQKTHCFSAGKDIQYSQQFDLQ